MHDALRSGRTRSRSSGTIRRSASRWPIAEPVLSARDQAGAPARRVRRAARRRRPDEGRRARRAIVTGGGTGVGRATALALAERGCHVLVNYSKSAAEAEETARRDPRARREGRRAARPTWPTTPPAARMVARAVGEFGRLDVLVNNAGTTSFIPHGDLEKVTDADWDKISRREPQGPVPVRARRARGAGARRRRRGGERLERGRRRRAPAARSRTARRRPASTC